MGYPINGVYYGGNVDLNQITLDSLNQFKIKAKMFMFRYQIPLVLLKWSAASKKFVEV